jgi:hypothetical protein
MPIPLNDNIKVSAPKPSDPRYLNTSNAPYANEAEVLSQIPETERHSGLTVKIGDVEYWFKTDTTTLEIKSSESSSLDTLLVTTTGSSISLDFNNKVERVFYSTSSFTGGKTIILSNDSNALLLVYHFQVTGSGAALTFPLNFKSSDQRFESSILTVTGAGYYEFTATYDPGAAIWKLKAEIDGGVL